MGVYDEESELQRLQEIAGQMRDQLTPDFPPELKATIEHYEQLHRARSETDKAGEV